MHDKSNSSEERIRGQNYVISLINVYSGFGDVNGFIIHDVRNVSDAYKGLHMVLV